jgi:hypothetical protein
VGGEIVVWGKINLAHNSTFNRNNLHFTKRLTVATDNEYELHIPYGVENNLTPNNTITIEMQL